MRKMDLVEASQSQKTSRHEHPKLSLFTVRVCAQRVRRKMIFTQQSNRNARPHALLKALTNQAPPFAFVYTYDLTDLT